MLQFPFDFDRKSPVLASCSAPMREQCLPMLQDVQHVTMLLSQCRGIQVRCDFDNSSTYQVNIQIMPKNRQRQFERNVKITSYLYPMKK